MDLGLDSSTAFYALGIIFGIFTITYFGFEVIVKISPVAKSAILLLSSLVFFSSSGLTESKWRKAPSYFLASVSYLIFVAYTMVKFDFGSVGNFLILAASSAAFLGAGYTLSEKDIEIPKDKAKYLVVGGILLIGGLFIFDASGPDAQVDFQPRNTVNLTEGEETSLGAVHVSNSFVLPRGFEVPNYDVCLPEENGRASVYVEDSGQDMVYQGQQLEMELKARFHPAVEYRNSSKNWETYKVVETEECVRKEGQISVFVREYDLD